MTIAPPEPPTLPPVIDPFSEPQPIIPHEGAITPYVVRGIVAAWDDVSSWAQKTWDHLFGGGANLDVPTTTQVKQMIAGAIDTMTKTAGSFVNTLEDWTHKIISHVVDTVNAVTTWTYTELLKVSLQMIDLSQTLVRLIQTEVQRALDFATAVGTLVTTALEAELSLLRLWAVTNIYTPLATIIHEVTVQLQQADQSILQEAKAYADQVSLQRVLTLLPAIAAIQQSIRTLQAFNDECAGPMCETMGPKTDLGKLLKNLAGLLGLLVGFEVAHLTEADLEHMAERLLSGATTPVEDLFSGFVQSGETVGSAATHVISDIGVAGLDILRELGVAV